MEIWSLTFAAAPDHGRLRSLAILGSRLRQTDAADTGAFEGDIAGVRGLELQGLLVELGDAAQALPEAKRPAQRSWHNSGAPGRG